jgi:serine/threonine protein kinase
VGDLLARRYKLERVLGWGGMAVVFQAVDTQRQSEDGSAPTLALKIVRTDLSPDDYQEAVSTLRWESYLLRRLRHHALPRLERFYSGSQMAWLAREMVAGVPLSQWLTQQGPCAPAIVRGWAVQVCDLLTYLHTRTPPVICGDIKPANLIVRSDYSLVLIDLGAAHTQTRRPPRRARPRYGTPGYAPPEQVGNWGMDERSDLFSLGVLCYELLTGNDPTHDPLQFDLEYLDDMAPVEAPLLRWALALDLTQRVPTAAVLNAALQPPPPAAPLSLGYNQYVSSYDDLLEAAMRHTRLIERALNNGTLEGWLAAHPDANLGALLHKLRMAQRMASARQRPIDTFLRSLAPSEGSPHLRVEPDQLDFGAIPLRHWRLWSQPRTLTLHNDALQPLHWELECGAQTGSDIRIAQDERPVRRAEGVLPPGGRTEISLVAAGRKGERRGVLTLRSGNYTTDVPWQAHAQPGVAVGRRFAARLEDLDMALPNLVDELETLLVRGVLARWLRAQKYTDLADKLEALANEPSPDATYLRLLIGWMLHPLAPRRFPLLQVHGAALAHVQVAPGDIAEHTLSVENTGQADCPLTWVSHCDWVTVDQPYDTLKSGKQQPYRLTLAPPHTLEPGVQTVTLELHAGDLVIPIELARVEIIERPWWQRFWNWLGGP